MLSDLHKKVMHGSYARLKKKMADMELSEDSPEEEASESPSEESMEKRMGLDKVGGKSSEADKKGPGDNTALGNDQASKEMDEDATGEDHLTGSALQEYLKGPQSHQKKPRGVMKSFGGSKAAAKRMPGRPKKMG